MQIVSVKQQKLDLGDRSKDGVSTQFAALCYRERNGKVQILLITSRRTKRWILPKGWPMDGLTPARAAETEAFEEAGVQGKMKNTCAGIYSYSKEVDDLGRPIIVAVFPLKVKKMLKDFPEKGQREHKWVSRKKAAQMVVEPELQQIIKNFDPSLLS